ncbi:tetrapyrrole methylase [Aureococcus anophagefferens]|uniref:Tetrapyrrole methylase n=1 Tax=Aureococcus anophagefferens TaxID=44056 RepID=A0ABR1FXG8_AURAN
MLLRAAAFAPITRHARKRLQSTASSDDPFAALGRRAVDVVAADGAARLYVVPTPLGEVADLTFRAVAALARADVVACEDTRRAGDLFARLGIDRASRGAFVRHDLQTAGASAPRLVDAMLRGDVVALVSDAGTPAVSDPGALLVREAAARGVVVRALPGACAATTALSASGFDSTNGFIFRGFVDGRGRSAARRRSLAAALASADDAPTVLYESPKRVRSLVAALDDLDGGTSQRPLVVARELTKTHEELWRGVLGDAAAWIDGGGAGAAAAGGDPAASSRSCSTRGPRRRATRTTSTLPRSPSSRTSGAGLAAAAAKAAAAQLGLRKSRVYQLAASTPRGRPNYNVAFSEDRNRRLTGRPSPSRRPGPSTSSRRASTGHGAAAEALAAARARADALQSQWLANLPRHLPTSNHWRKASALDDPTSGVFWSGSLHTPAVRAFMTPTVVHRTRSNALRKVRFPVRTALYDVHPVENRPRPHTAPKYL